MAQSGRPQPEQLAQELKVVAKAGIRAGKLRTLLPQLTGLCHIADSGGHDREAWDLALEVAHLVQHAAQALGDGSYGRSAAALLGIAPSTRGLLYATRHRAAAAELGVETSTFVRHWERRILEDMAAAIYAQGNRDE